MLSDISKRLMIRDLESYPAKLQRWRGEQPVPAGVRIANTADFMPAHVHTDGAGNILLMPKLVEKPCFGIPTAYLRHGRQKARYVKRIKERVHTSRCDRCKVNAACRKVVKERLVVAAKAEPEFKEVIKIWADAGGLEEGGFDRATGSVGKGVWTRLTHLLSQFDFHSSNDNVVSAHWEARTVKADHQAKTKQCSSLRRAWREQKELAPLIVGLDEGVRERSSLLNEVLSTDQCPLYLKRLPGESVNRITAIWWGREFARLTGKKTNPNAIASILIERGRHGGKSHSVLRDAVKTDLERIRRLETNASYNGGKAIWPKFRHPALLEPPTF